MWTRHHKRRNTGQLIMPAIAVAALSYFGYHAYHGDYGINAKKRLEAQIVELEAERQALAATRTDLEERVGLVQDRSLEKDMLDEQARRALNVARDNEIVILYPSHR